MQYNKITGSVKETEKYTTELKVTSYNKGYGNIGLGQYSIAF